MSEEFHDWLDQCPVMWIRDRVEKDHVFYAFATPDEDENEDQIQAQQFIKLLYTRPPGPEPGVRGPL